MPGGSEEGFRGEEAGDAGVAGQAGIGHAEKAGKGNSVCKLLQQDMAEGLLRT